MESILDDIRQGLEDGTMTAEEANALLPDIQRALEIEDDSLDMVMKGHMLTTLAAIQNLL
jgi:polyhydroxyalkanoate synthesis regulator phasin